MARHFVAFALLVSIGMATFSNAEEPEQNGTGYNWIDAAGFGKELKSCEQYPPQEQAGCVETQDRMNRLLWRVLNSRSENARKFISDYLSGEFAPIVQCLRTSCIGNFATAGASALWADSWERILSFQACIHANAAVAPKLETLNYSAHGRLLAALEGRVPDCPPQKLTEHEQEILKYFNGGGTF